MFDLSVQEKRIVIIILAILILGLGISMYEKSCLHGTVKIGSFAVEKESLHRRININTADIEELAGLKGIGNAIAVRIVEYRSQKGQFVSIEEIKKIKGIGPALFEKIKDDIAVE